MKKIIFMAVMAVAALPASAQDTYENAKIATTDLNGTARYVGMGGAMEALGADISTISTNPAGIGASRKSSVNFSLGLVNQQGAEDFGGGYTTNMSFDQAGFVWANQISETDFVNFAFNYHKSRNFNYILSAADKLQGGSQHAVTYLKALDGILYPFNSDNTPNLSAKPSWETNQLDELFMQHSPLVWNGFDWGYYDATDYTLDRATKGYIANYEFNLSGNVQDRFYWGATVGVHDVNYSHYGEYVENLIGDDNYVPKDYHLLVSDDRHIDGTGFDLKLGIIFRPIEESPLRFGISVATPTWYTLTTDNYTTVRDWGGRFSNGDTYDAGKATCENFRHDFKLYTPWKFGLSAGHTIGNMLALGASYEYTDYAHLDTRYDTSDAWHNSSESDDEMNRHTGKTLRGVSTFKVGAELKPAPELAVRLGYNYVSPMYKDYFKDGAVSSAGTSVSTTTDFTNWDATHRITCGLGFQLDKFNIALAYQYATQKGKFEPFYYESIHDDSNYIDANKLSVSNKRHQVLLTLGYTF